MNIANTFSLTTSNFDNVKSQRLVSGPLISNIQRTEAPFNCFIIYEAGDSVLMLFTSINLSKV